MRSQSICQEIEIILKSVLSDGGEFTAVFGSGLITAYKLPSITLLVVSFYRHLKNVMITSHHLNSAQINGETKKSKVYYRVLVVVFGIVLMTNRETMKWPN